MHCRRRDHGSRTPARRPGLGSRPGSLSGAPGLDDAVRLASVHPERSVSVVLALPYRQIAFEGLDRLRACEQRRSSMRRGRHHHNAHLADSQRTDAMNHGQGAQVVMLGDLGGDAEQLPLRHGQVRVVVQRLHRATRAAVANYADEGRDRAVGIAARLGHELVDLDGICDQRGVHAASRLVVNRPAGHRRHERDFVAGLHLRLPVAVAEVPGHPQSSARVPEVGVVMGHGGPEVEDRGHRLADQDLAAEPLTQPAEANHAHSVIGLARHLANSGRNR